MNKKIGLFNDICCIFMEIILMTVLFLLPQAIVNPEHTMSFTGIYIICLMAVTDYLMKMYCRNFIIFLAGHAVFLPVILFTGFSIEKVIPLALFVVFLFITSISFWKVETVTSRQGLLEMPLVAVTVCIAVEMLSRFLHLKQLISLSLLLGIIFAALYFLRLYLTNMLMFINGNAESKNTPFEKIFYINSSCNIVLLFVCALLIIITNIAQAGKAFSYLGHEFKLFLMFLIRLIPTPNKQDTVTKVKKQITAAPTKNPLFNLGNQKTNPVVDTIMNVIAYIIFAAVIIFLLYLIYRGVKEIMKRHLPKAGTLEFTQPILKTEKIKDKNKDFSLPFLSFGRTNNQKIRRIYHKKVKDYKKSLVDITAYDTPEEIKDKIKIKTDHSIDILTGLYEQVRYGEKELSKEDVEAAKKDQKAL